jgi:hypothetical protein
MAIEFDLIDVTKTRTTACNGDAVAWILSSQLDDGDPELGGPKWGHCILVQPQRKISSHVDLDRLTAGVREKPCTESLEQWLDGLSEDLKDANFYICLDLPPFSKANLQCTNALLDAVARNSTAQRPTIYGVSPILRNWLSLPLHGFIQSEFNASEHAGVQITKFLAAFISPSAHSCIDIMQFEDFVGAGQTPAILLQGTWDCNTGLGLRMSPGDLEIVKGSTSIVAISAGTPFHASVSRLFVEHLTELATDAEFVHVMNHSGILQDPEMPYTQGEVAIHLLCSNVHWSV